MSYLVFNTLILALDLKGDYFANFLFAQVILNDIPGIPVVLHRDNDLFKAVNIVNLVVKINSLCRSRFQLK